MPINEKGEFIRSGSPPPRPAPPRSPGAEAPPPRNRRSGSGGARALVGVLALVGVVVLVVGLLQSIPPQLGTPPSGPRPSVQPPQRGTSGPPSLPVDSPVDVIRSYYADLDRRDGGSAVGKWKDPNREKLLNLIKRIEWFKTQDVRLVQSDTYSAQVAIDVIGKNFNEKPKNWVGVITLEKVNNKWQIASMKDLRERK